MTGDVVAEVGELLTIGEAAKALGLPRHKVQAVFDAGKLAPALTLGGRRFVRRSDLALVARKVGRQPKPERT
jgi:excisionase family DNA binding protein